MKRIAWLAFALVPALGLVGCGGDVECYQVGDEVVCVDVAEQAVIVDEVSNHGGGCGGGGSNPLWRIRMGQIDGVLAGKTSGVGRLEQPRCDLADPALCPMNTHFTVTVPGGSGPTGDPTP